MTDKYVLYVMLSGKRKKNAMKAKADRVGDGTQNPGFSPQF